MSNYNYIRFSDAEKPFVTNFVGVDKGQYLKPPKGYKLYSRAFIMEQTKEYFVKKNPYELAKELGLVLRESNESDMDAIKELENKAFDPIAGLIDEQAKGIIYVLEKNGVIVGKVNLDINERFAYLDRVCIANTQRGFGYGTILEELFLWLANEKQSKKKYMWVVETNTNAHKFHQKFGFTMSNKCSWIFIKE